MKKKNQNEVIEYITFLFFLILFFALCFAETHRKKNKCDGKTFLSFLIIKLGLFIFKKIFLQNGKEKYYFASINKII